MYSKYFNIDKEYFPQVTENEMASHPDMWRKFCAHATFRDLLDSTLSMLEHRLNRSVWVEGAYGTGKTHAVLTMLKLFDAAEDECRGYFEEYNAELGGGLLNRLLGVKEGRRVLTVFRSGSSDIREDRSLCFDIQESVIASLKSHGMNAGEGGLCEGVLERLQEKWAYNAVKELISGEYSNMFGGRTVDEVIEIVKNGGSTAAAMIEKLMRLGDEKDFRALSLDVNRLASWLRAVMEANKLDSIIFVWDEFTEFFQHNAHALTGFQQLAEMVTETRQFCFVPVTHNVWNVLDGSALDVKKVRDRFKPCRIELPDGMAVRLMGHAMRLTSDEKNMDDWKDISADLATSTKEARAFLCEKTRIEDADMMRVLPVHPFAAVMLSHIATAFGSNQRSMFEFLNDSNEETQGFAYFINHNDPYSASGVLLTIDMLWNFFYEQKGDDKLSPAILSVLDSAGRARSQSLTAEETSVLHTVLLMQAVSQGARDTIEFFVPDVRNLEFSFEGVNNMGAANARRIANELCNKGLLCKTPMTGGKERYAAMVTSADGARLETEMQRIKDTKRTNDLIAEGALGEAFIMQGFGKTRFEVVLASYDDISRELKKSTKAWQIRVIIAVSRDDAEGGKIEAAIQAVLPNCADGVIIVDASSSPLGSKEYDSYVEAQAGATVYRQMDTPTFQGHERNAKAVLSRWRERIKRGTFTVWRCKDGSVESEQVTGADTLIGRLESIDKSIYTNGLETGSAVIDTMWEAKQLAPGVVCGAGQSVSGTYRNNNPRTQLSAFIGDSVWQKNRQYWEEEPHLLISRIKCRVDSVVKEGFENNGRVSVLHLVETMMKKPFGFMPCNLTAFVLGFALKECCTGEYRWSDNLNGGELGIDKLKEMVSEAMKEVLLPSKNFHEQYIAKRTVEERAFDKATHKIFAIDTDGVSMERVRGSLCACLKGLSFPLWTIKYSSAASGNADVKRLIDFYCELLNPANGDNKEYSAIVKDIGSMLLSRPALSEEAAAVINANNCREGMKAYLDTYNGGQVMRLASLIGADTGRVLEDVRAKFSSSESKWLWSNTTGDEQIDTAAMEYSIVAESNKVNPIAHSFNEAVDVWQERCNNIHIACAVLKESAGEPLGDLLDVLCNMIMSGGEAYLQDVTRKKQLLDAIIAGGAAFKEFYNDPVPYFAACCSFYLDPHGFSDDELRDIYNRLPDGSFVQSKKQCLSLVEQAVKQFVSERAGDKLRRVWKDKTKTANPTEWSEKYKMPVRCLFPSGYSSQAEAAVRAASEKHPGKEESEAALIFFETSAAQKMFSDMQDAAARDESFRQSILGTYAAILHDVSAVKDYVLSVCSVPPAEWMGNSDVLSTVEKMARTKYDQGGMDEALAKINDMPSEKVKEYLKGLIRANMKVGIEIMRDRKEGQ